MNPRRCVACRRALHPDQMTRFVRRPDGTVVLQGEKKEQGRGAYLCSDPRCLVLARKKGLLSKALKAPVPDELLDELERLHSEVLQGRDEAQDLGRLLGLCRRAGELIIGQDRVVESLKEGQSLVVLCASDCPEKLRLKVGEDALQVRVLEQDRTSLGGWIGLNSAVMVALKDESGFLPKVQTLIPKGGTDK